MFLLGRRAAQVVEGCRVCASKVLVLSRAPASWAPSGIGAGVACVGQNLEAGGEASAGNGEGGAGGTEGCTEQTMCESFLRWTVALPVAVKDFLRGECGSVDDVAGVLG